MMNHTLPSTRATLRFRIEREIAMLLISKLENQEITPKKASQVAHFITNTIPDNISDESMMELIPSLDDQFFELASIVAIHIREYEDRYRPIVETKVQTLIDNGQFSEASSLMTKYFQKKFHGK
jgi:hypothetical protein